MTRKPPFRRGWALALSVTVALSSSCGSEGPAAPTQQSTAEVSTASGRGPTWTPSEPGATPDETLASWFAANDTPYVGDCGDVPADTELGTWCTSLFSADDVRRIYRSGQIRSEFATWLLLTRSAGQWAVADVAPGGDPAGVPWP